VSAPRRRGEDGVAAVEFALISTVLLLLAFAAVPLFEMARAYQRTNSSAADALRYATSVDANAHKTDAGVFTRRPTAKDVTKFAQAAGNNPNFTVTVKICPGGNMNACAVVSNVDAASTAVSGDVVVVTVSQSVDLSLIGSVANAIGSLVGSGNIAPHGAITITSTSTGREE
jgi:Flp pilus assembly protein TadG